MKINFDSPYKVDDGYGAAGEAILLALDQHPQVEVFTDKNWSHTTGVAHGLTKRTMELYNRGFDKNADFSIRFCQPDSFANAPPCRKVKIGWSMWEYTNIPKAWVPGSNNVPAMFVSCTHNKKIWEKAGTRTPIYVIPLGVNSGVFYYRTDNTFDGPRTISKPDRTSVEYNRPFDGFTFVMSGTVCVRKQPGLLYRTFNKLFADKNDVRLIMKTPKRLPLGFKSTHNIKIISKTWLSVRIADLLRECDCFVYPTQGEGFGLSPIEAMAVGNTAIVTNWSGPKDYLDDAYSYKLNYSLAGTVGSHWGDVFGFALPDEKQLEELMWYVYNHQEEAKAKGRLAAKFVAKNMTWKHTAQKIVDVLKRL